MNDAAELVQRIGNSRNPRITIEQIRIAVPFIAHKREHLDEIEARALIKLLGSLFKQKCLEAGRDERKIRALTTKFRDAGRRSAPWKPTSSRVPGRPQDGSDGNRINRWLLPADHKFYANEITATLVEVKYILQTLSMENAPDISEVFDTSVFTPWLLEHELAPGKYLDPVQLIPIDFSEFIGEPRSIQSGHIFPLDRGGIHEPSNTFLMLFRSNQLQGNLTVEELLNLLREIIQRHDEAMQSGSQLEHLIRKSSS